MNPRHIQCMGPTLQNSITAEGTCRLGTMHTKYTHTHTYTRICTTPEQRPGQGPKEDAQRVLRAVGGSQGDSGDWSQERLSIKSQGFQPDRMPQGGEE